ncbi:helix-turn-helix domain-containing protein [Ornithinibacillus halophilus]|uniref:Transcriptional regulator, XRE family n=1 Tax=Ornithinibacillus halophilus TaxID=930117 RepID=A0A1M5JI22_9BACI|nr:helix-turn-helix transcriptional regulator [Ornithinibacillus halophilus]SHG40197.1 transcriptional regulator, XRE family [Ornithinibacillus halophilus]
MDRKRIGRRIRGFRKLKGYTQMDFAKRLGVPLAVLGSVERGTREIPEGLIEQIAGTLNIEKDELLKLKVE